MLRCSSFGVVTAEMITSSWVCFSLSLSLPGESMATKRPWLIKPTRARSLNAVLRRVAHHQRGKRSDHSLVGVPLQSDVDGEDSGDDRAGDDGEGLLERISGIEASHDEGDTPNDVSNE